jgi:hypothetical protein
MLTCPGAQIHLSAQLSWTSTLQRTERSQDKAGRWGTWPGRPVCQDRPTKILPECVKTAENGESFKRRLRRKPSMLMIKVMGDIMQCNQPEHKDK